MNRKKSKPHCGKCKQEGNFRSVPLKISQNRPHFECNNCGNTWSYGLTGGKYADFLKERGDHVYYPKE